MRLITLTLLALVLLLQYPLWLGKGGWLRVHEIERQLQVQQETNARLKARNDKLAAEVADLRDGAGALEERARYELGMIREGEVFVQTVEPVRAPGAGVAQRDAPSTANGGAAPPTSPGEPAK